MQGRRRQPGTRPREGDDQEVATIPYEDLEPGDYCGPITGWTGEVPAVFFLLPDAQGKDLRHVCAPPHTFIEEADGTLTIQPSILFGGSGGWHGYLEHGVWREV